MKTGKARVAAALLAACLTQTVATGPAMAWASSSMPTVAGSQMALLESDMALSAPDVLPTETGGGQASQEAGPLGQAPDLGAGQALGATGDVPDGGAASPAASLFSAETYASLQEAMLPNGLSWGVSSEDMQGMQSTLADLFVQSGADSNSATLASIASAASGGVSMTDAIASAFGMKLDATPYFSMEQMGFNPNDRVDLGVMNSEYLALASGLSMVADTALSDLSGKTGDVMQGFTSAFGNINQQTLEAPQMPKGFDPDKMLEDGLASFQSAYSGALDSDAFKVAKSTIGIGDVFNVALKGLDSDLTSMLESSSATQARLSGAMGGAKASIEGEYNGHKASAEAASKASYDPYTLSGFRNRAFGDALKVVDFSNCMAIDYDIGFNWDEHRAYTQDETVNSIKYPTATNAAGAGALNALRSLANVWGQRGDAEMEEKYKQADEKKQTVADTIYGSIATDKPESAQSSLYNLIKENAGDLQTSGANSFQLDDGKGGVMNGVIIEGRGGNPVAVVTDEQGNVGFYTEPEDVYNYTIPRDGQ